MLPIGKRGDWEAILAAHVVEGASYACSWRKEAMVMVHLQLEIYTYVQYSRTTAISSRPSRTSLSIKKNYARKKIY